MDEFYVHLIHILIFSTLLGYIGIEQTKMPKYIYPFILFLGALVIVYHIYKSIFKKDAWVNYIHILIIGPLLVYIGINKEDTPKKAFEIILMLAFASLGYHGYYMIT
jgi:uncharacterized membrane protein